ncbi:dihydropyrimidinase-like isoform X1 [Telopea speciosissima]|uniref:dihydropyrimidinase-like isoform X1 n=2 Tax=Telopea speciosissima TaxID=54955 RepID=UPI001CC7F206|nr:dihydropyrimidinase-like isoform X1 [Telopea speciosissima]
MMAELRFTLPWRKLVFGVQPVNLFSVIVCLLVIFPISESEQVSGFCGAAYGESEGCSYSSKLLIKGGTVVNAHHQELADVYVEDGIIVSVQPNINVGDDVKVIDATGKYVMPGGIDPHTHLETHFIYSDTVDDFFTGQAAALAGGTTMNINFAMPINGSLTAGFEDFAKKAKKSCMDYGFHMAITKWDEVVAKEMEIMVEKGINSFKFFLAYKPALMINDELLIRGMRKCKSLGALPMVHAENGDAIEEAAQMMIDLGITGPEGHALSRPPVLEGEATARAIRLAAFVNTPLYVVHVMSIDAMEEIARARQAGQRVIGEPIGAGLVLEESGIFDPDFTTAAKYLMSPPIRKAGHDKALQAALSTGVLQLVGSDHCSFNSTQKALGIDDFRKIPNGVNGIEERMHVVWDSMVESGLITPSDYVRITSTECARIFNIYPRKGAILAGSDADIIVLNPNASFEISAATQHRNSDTNAFEGISGKGKVEVTIAGGRVVWEGDELKVVPGSGRYIEMPPFSYLFNGIDKADAAYLSSLNAPVQRVKAVVA